MFVSHPLLIYPSPFLPFRWWWPLWLDGYVALDTQLSTLTHTNEISLQEADYHSPDVLIFTRLTAYIQPLPPLAYLVQLLLLPQVVYSGLLQPLQLEVYSDLTQLRRLVVCLVLLLQVRARRLLYHIMLFHV